MVKLILLGTFRMGHLAHTSGKFQRILRAIPHKARLTALHAQALCSVP